MAHCSGYLPADCPGALSKGDYRVKQLQRIPDCRFLRCWGMSSTVRLSYLLIHLHSFACQLCVRQSPGVVSVQAACPTRQRRLGGLVRPRPKLSTVCSTLFTSRSFCTLQRSFVLNATVKPIFVNFTTLRGAILHDPITTFSLYKKIEQS